MTGDQHTGHISNGQRVSRHSLPTLQYYLFSPPHIFFNSFFASRTFGTFAFAPTHKANPSAKAKEPNLPPHRHSVDKIISDNKVDSKTSLIFDIHCQANKSKMDSLGEIFRKEREKRNLLLRQVASSIDMDQAVLSKIEREERKATKQQLIDLIKFYELDEKQIMVEWNSQKLLNQLKSENYAIDILNQSIKKLKAKK